MLARQAAILVHMYDLGKHYPMRPRAQSNVDLMKFALLIGSYGQRAIIWRYKNHPMRIARVISLKSTYH